MKRSWQVACAVALVSLAGAFLMPPAARAFLGGPRVMSNDEIFDLILDLVDFGYRRPGSPAEAQAVSYIEDRFRQYGLQDVHREPVPMKRWDAHNWSLTLQDGDEIDSFYIPYTQLTGPEGHTGELVYVGEGDADDYADAGSVEGDIVVADIRFLDLSATGVTNHSYSWVISNWEAYEHAVDGGAAGFVGILRDYWDRNTYYAPADNPSKPFDTRPVPGLWLSKSDGDALLSRMQEGSATRASLVLEGNVDPEAEMLNVVGMLPGETDDIIMVHSHHDAPFYGAVEDASGVAEVLAIAKYFGEIPADWRKKTLLFLSASGHFYNYEGNRAFLRNHPELMDRVLVDFCVEHVAMEWAEMDGEIVPTGEYELSGLFVSSPVMQPIATAAAWGWGLENNLVLPYPFSEFFSDAADYQAAGIPVVSYISGPQYIYDLIDTPDKVAKDQLRPVAGSFVDMIVAADELAPSAFTQY